MSRGAASWLAWSLWALCVVLVVLAVLLYFYTSSERPYPRFEVLAGVPLLVYPTIGAFIASHRPKNAVGWVLCGMGFVIEGLAFSRAYADYSLFAHPGSLPGEKAMDWLTPWDVGPGLMLGAVLLVLLFPDGKLPHRGWWAVVLMAVCGTALLNYRAVTWPGGVEELGILGEAILLVSFVASLIPVIVRLQSAEARERQQFKWFAYGTAVFLGALFLMYAAFEIGGPWAQFVVIVTGLSAIPVAVGIAILRYRLYDIDRLISRTLVYGSLTLMLALVYFGSVTATQALFTALTDQEELPQLVVVASTLLIAALFNPLRKRIQSFIDRRFYRRKYDARKTLEAFSAKLRDETDLDALRADLVGVVGETMQPAHVSLWLRPAGEPKAKSAQAIADSVGPITMPPEKEHQRGEGTLGGATRRTRVNRRGLWAACVVLILLIGGVGALTTVGTVGAGCAKDKDSARAKCCSEATLNGRYLLAFDGFIVEGDEKVPFAVANFEVFDGTGNAKGVSSFSVNGKITRREPFSATYNVKANCTGTITVYANVVTHYDFFTAPDGTMITFVQTDPGVVAAGSQLRGTAKRVGE
jgi:hypothetical protein